MAREITNFIDGATSAAADGRTYDVIDPTTAQVYAKAPLSGEADIDRANKAAAKAFESWRDTTPYERQKAMLKLAAAVEERAEEIGAVESKDTGKPLALTMT
ncbi:MAG: aldehyde dehydrogenase family protein, partial [Aeromicrobium sp.]